MPHHSQYITMYYLTRTCITIYYYTRTCVMIYCYTSSCVMIYCNTSSCVMIYCNTSSCAMIYCNTSSCTTICDLYLYKNFMYGNVSQYLPYKAIYEFDIFADDLGAVSRISLPFASTTEVDLPWVWRNPPGPGLLPASLKVSNVGPTPKSICHGSPWRALIIGRDLCTAMTFSHSPTYKRR